MLDLDQIKKIAYSLNYRVRENTLDIMVRIGDEDCFDYYEPVDNDAQNHLVFKALVDECKKRGEMIIEIGDGEILVYNEYGDRTAYFEDDFNNENICLAYLKVMESK